MVAGVIFVRAASHGEVAAPSPPVSHTPMLWTVGGLALAIALLFRVGFPLAVALFTMTARGLGSRHSLRSALIGLAIGLVIYATFFPPASASRSPPGCSAWRGRGTRSRLIDGGAGGPRTRVRRSARTRQSALRAGGSSARHGGGRVAGSGARTHRRAVPALTYTLAPTSSFIVFAGVYYAAMHGGSTTRFSSTRRARPALPLAGRSCSMGWAW